MHIALAGPCAPPDVADLLAPTASSMAKQLTGDRNIFVSDLAREFVRLGHEVSVGTITWETTEDQSLLEGPSFRLFTATGRPRARHKLLDLYGQERTQLRDFLWDVHADVVNAHWTYEFELAAQDSGLPHFTTAHDAPVTILRQTRHWYRAARLLIAAGASRRVSALSCVSPYLAARWKREMAFRGSIEVIPNSIPSDVVLLPRQPNETPTILDVASEGRLKNVPGLLRAFALVRKRVPDAQLRLAGPGLGPESRTATWAASQGLAIGVTFLGVVSRDRLAQEYSSAWVMAHGSLEEACPISILEALGAGLPVVGGEASGGVPFVLDNGRVGRLCDVTDPVQFGGVLTEMVASGPPANPGGARTYVENNFAAEVVAKKYLSWYARGTDQRARR